jgi:hypothetical protein
MDPNTKRLIMVKNTSTPKNIGENAWLCPILNRMRARVRHPSKNFFDEIITTSFI